jgi:hypothetical protein
MQCALMVGMENRFTGKLRYQCVQIKIEQKFNSHMWDYDYVEMATVICEKKNFLLCKEDRGPLYV